MAPPVGTLRVGRYFLALLAIFAVLYSVVALSARSTPKLGLDLVGGIRVIFTAQTPKGSPPPTSAQMTQARQILQDRIDGYGVTGSTVVVQGNDQLVVEIPNGTSADVARLGKAAILNFRGVVAPAQPVSCKAAASTGKSSSTQPSNGSSGAGSNSSSAGTAGTSPSASPSGAVHSGAANSARPLAAPAATPARNAASSTAPASTAPASSASSSPTPTSSASAPAALSCLADPFTNSRAPAIVKALPAQLAATYKVTAKNASIWNLLPNAETCPSTAVGSSECRAYSVLSSAEQQAIATGLQLLDCSSVQTQVEPDLPTGAYYACDNGKLFGTPVAYLLGAVVVPGRTIGSATAQAPNISNGGTQWTVALTLTNAGANRWSAWTSKYNTTSTTASAIQTSATPPCGVSTGTPCSDFVGFTLDGQVISAPITEAALDINTSISGNFTQSSANELARELNYGKLPVSFRADSNSKVSATLGTQQLNAALLAGGIGLLLVVLYSLLYYRALGIVTIASLLVSAGLTYAMLVILGKQIGFTLDLAGIAGFIVALGITADSFVVFFERLKDEVHSGRSVRVAVPRAWVRARRTILSADTVSFLAAAILYYFASADVKGFAFTLGMSTILDLVVVFLFTHPLVSVLSRSSSFGSSRVSGLDALRGAPVPDDEPVAPRARGGAKPVPTNEPDGGAAERFRGVAVLERRDRSTPQAPEPTGATAVSDTTEAAAPPTGDTEPASEASGGAPEASSAAERAAARQARLRAKRGRPSDDGTGN